MKLPSPKGPTDRETPGDDAPEVEPLAVVVVGAPKDHEPDPPLGDSSEAVPVDQLPPVPSVEAEPINISLHRATK